MGRAKDAPGRSLRGFGWSVAIPFAAAIGVIISIVGSLRPGVTVAAVISLIGLVVVLFGQMFGDILDGYWMVLLGAASVPVAALTWVHGDGYAWAWSLAICGVVIMMVGIVAGIMAHSSRDSRGWLITKIFASFIPG